MKYPNKTFTWVLAGSVALALTGCSDRATDAGRTGMAPAPIESPAPAATPMPTPMSVAPATNTAPDAMHASDGFDRYAQGRDSLSYQEVAHDAWFAQHFSECDTDNDGALTRDEWRECRRSAGNEGNPNASRSDGMPASAGSAPQR